MRNLTILAGLFVLAVGQVAVAAEATNKPIVIAATVSKATQEQSVPEGSLEKFGAAGLPQ
jgi:hypothetical protein